MLITRVVFKALNNTCFYQKIDPASATIRQRAFSVALRRLPEPIEHGW
jgi:hypothetical protein